MNPIKRGIRILLVLLAVNPLLVAARMPGTAAAILCCALLALFFLQFNLRPVKDRSAPARLRILRGGRELALTAMWCFPLEAAAYLVLILRGPEVDTHILVINAVLCAVLLLISLLNGLIRIFACSRQIGLAPKLLLLFLWWVPVLNLMLLRTFLRTSQKEYVFSLQKHTRNAGRRERELCKTQYPILMVHGIFFRDWKVFNYWGRISKELEANGAAIHYGSQQSSAAVEQSAQELAQSIREIVERTGCGKVNIIAHSKGGLDARYAISRLGMGECVASLTTINTPHLGCNYVGRLLELIPKKLVAAIGNKYKSLYTKLGDDNPDFFSGLSGLTDKECARLNELMPDLPGVLCQSVGSRMRSFGSAMFPLNVGYALIRLCGGGDNDGLVSTQSMAWGDFLGVLAPPGKQGISHGDMIDLTRKDIEGFDVCEFYVDLVAKLKEKGM